MEYGFGMKFRARVNLDTHRDIERFVHLVSGLPCSVYLTSGPLCVSGKSILGAIYTLEWDDLWCECEKDIYHIIREFIVE